MGKRYTLMLNFGYVESTSLSFMPWFSLKMFKDAKDALLSLSTFLKEKFLEESQVTLKKCCALTQERDADAEFCTKCGHPLASAEFDGENFVEWLREIGASDIDTFNGLATWDREDLWMPVQSFQHNPRVVHQAEWVIAAAVGYSHNDARTFEQICKERTKTKADSFTYY
jgi:hypothetical protein